MACARFLLSEPWRVQKMVPLAPHHIVEKIGRWATAGRPESWAEWEATRAAPRRGGGAAEPAGFAAIRAFGQSALADEPAWRARFVEAYEALVRQQQAAQRMLPGGGRRWTGTTARDG